MSKWERLEEDQESVMVRTIILKNMETDQQLKLDEFVDWDGNVTKREGDLRLQPLMDVTIKMESEFDELDKEAMIKRAAPALKKILEELTGEPVDENELVNTIDVQTGGNWKGFKRGPKFQRLQ